MNKTILTKQFNVRFKDLTKYMRNKLSNNLYVLSQLDTMESKTKGNGNRTIIHVFVDYIVNNKEISQNIRKGNDKFFDNITHSKYGEKKIFVELKNIYNNTNINERKYIMKEIDNLRKLARAYDKASE